MNTELKKNESPINLLLVDDSPTDRTIFKRHLSNNNSFEFEFDEVDSVFEALKYLNRKIPDCILLDFSLPDSDGTELINEINAKFGKNKIPIIMLSGSSNIETAVETLHLGAHDFLVKSNAKPSELLRAVLNSIDKVQLHKAKKEVENKILKSEAFNRTLTEISPDCVMVLDKNGNMMFVNENGLRLWEIDDADSIRNKNGHAIWIPECRKLIDKTMEVARKGEKGRFEISCLTVKENPKWWDVIVTPIKDSQGNVDTILSVSRDITENKLIEKEREKSLEREKELRAQAESANRAKDEFLAIISHELRSPLNAMSGWSKILQKGSLDETKKRHAIDVIDRNIQLQNSLIEDLLDVSRIMSDKIKLKPIKIDLCKEITKAVENVRPLATENNINLSFATDLETCVTYADLPRIQQIIGNLLTNAIKFTPRRGEIKVHLRTSDNNLIISVKDNGIGIEEDLLPFIFDRFRQADGSTKRKFGGLGLGLSIVKSLVELHNGEISVVSEGKDKGTEFTVSLPLISKKERTDDKDTRLQTALEPVEGKLLNKLQITIVEDDADSLELITFILQNEGAEIQGFTNAEKALKSIGENIPDVVLSDISMAEMDGFDFIQKLKEIGNKKNQTIPVAAVTAYTSVGEKDKVLSAGFQMHISKPIDVEHLPIQIRQLVDSQVQ